MQQPTIPDDWFDIMFYSTLTMIYKAIPVEGSNPLKYCDECTASARSVLYVHYNAWQKFQGEQEELWNLLVHWYVVLF